MAAASAASVALTDLKRAGQSLAPAGGFSEARIEAAGGQPLNAIFTPLLSFRDKGVFVFGPAQPVIHVRSRSLLGYRDFGKSRSRTQALAERFAAAQQP